MQIVYTIFSFLVSGVFLYIGISSEVYIDKVVFLGFFIIFFAISIKLLFKLKKYELFCKDGFIYIDSKKYSIKQVSFIGRTLEVDNIKIDIDNEKLDELKFCLNDIKFGYFKDYVIIKNEKFTLKDIKDVYYEFELVDGSRIYINAKVETKNKTITFKLKSLFLQKHFIKFLKAYKNIDFEYKYELKFSYIEALFIIGIVLMFLKEPFSIIGIWLAFFGGIGVIRRIKNYFLIQNYLKKLKEEL